MGEASPTVAEIFREQTVLLTGGLGFMGKMLLYKLLKSCPHLSTIILIIRPKRGISFQRRWEKVTRLEMFQTLFNQCPEVLDKVHLMEGDLSMENAGLSEEDYMTVTQKVTTVFHVAASVMFLEQFTSSLKNNVLATLHIAKLAKAMQRLKCFVHVSTAFSNCDKPDAIEEKLYPPPYDWHHLLQVMETGDEHTLCSLTNKILEGHPNSYTLTKALAEHVISEFTPYYRVAIVRPSVVVNAYEEPFKGWIDKLSGPHSCAILIGTGIWRVFYIKETRLDYTFGDFAINALIIAAWSVTHDSSVGVKSDGPQVFNSTFGERLIVSSADCLTTAEDLSKVDPFEKMLWLPGAVRTNSLFVYHSLSFILHFLPALVFDGICRALRKEPRMIKLVVKLASVMSMYHFFMTRPWSFPCNSIVSTHSRLSPEDRSKFRVDPQGITSKEAMTIACVGLKKYFLKEKEEDLPRRLKVYRRFKIADQILKLLIFIALAWLVIKKVSWYLAPGSSVARIKDF